MKKGNNMSEKSDDALRLRLYNEYESLRNESTLEAVSRRFEIALELDRRWIAYSGEVHSEYHSLNSLLYRLIGQYTAEGFDHGRIAEEPSKEAIQATTTGFRIWEWLENFQKNYFDEEEKKQVHRSRAEAFLCLKNFRQALDEMDRFLEFFSDSFDGYIFRSYIRKLMLESARHTGGQAAIDPTTLNLAMEDALRAVKFASSPEELAWAYRSLGHLSQMNGDEAGAKSYFERAETIRKMGWNYTGAFYQK